jgi:hypothetical protein
MYNESRFKGRNHAAHAQAIAPAMRTRIAGSSRAQVFFVSTDPTVRTTYQEINVLTDVYENKHFCT